MAKPARAADTASMKLVVFDIDGTLLDNLAAEDDCYVQALRDGLGLTAVSAVWRWTA